jgi:hypothetical protein
MSDILKTASTWLEARRHAVATTDVVYRREDRAVTLRATIGRQEYQQDDGAGVITRAEDRDFLIRATDLVIDGMRVLPEAGDRIEEADNGTLFIYEVLPVSNAQPCYRYSDPYRQTLRIHTKLIGEEGGSICRQ